MKQEVRSAGFSTDSVKRSLMKRLARCRLFIRPAQHIWVSFWPNKTTLCITVKCMENIRSVCPHACVWMSVCLKKRENMFVIKMTEYEGEVPLEGWVATYLHTHTRTYFWMFFHFLKFNDVTWWICWCHYQESNQQPLRLLCNINKPQTHTSLS